MVLFSSLGDVTVAHIRGEIDVYRFDAVQLLRDAAARVRYLVVSLEECQHFSNDLTRLFARLSNSLGDRFALAGPSTHCRRLLELVGLDRKIGIFETVEEAAKTVSFSSSAMTKAVTSSVNRSLAKLSSAKLEMKIRDLYVPAELPQPTTAAFSAWYEAAHGSDAMGGDWYSAKALDADRIFFSIGDVAGHGLDVSVTMDRTRQAIFALAATGKTPATILKDANKVLTLSNAVATCLVGILTVSTREFRCASAGHGRPIVVSPDGKARFVGGCGPPLGADDAPGFLEFKFAVRPGGRVVLYTDGLLEFDRDLLLGEQRLLRAAADLQPHIETNVAETFAKSVLCGSHHSDDTAVLTISF